MGTELFVVGCSHRTAPLELRESLAFAPDQVLEALRLARHEKVLAETMILSTCHRTEFYSLTADAPGRVYVRR
jgi:glutamyl-tRNA reductase